MHENEKDDIDMLDEDEEIEQEEYVEPQNAMFLLERRYGFGVNVWVQDLMRTPAIKRLEKLKAEGVKDRLRADIQKAIDEENWPQLLINADEVREMLKIHSEALKVYKEAWLQNRQQVKERELRKRRLKREKARTVRLVEQQIREAINKYFPSNLNRPKRGRPAKKK